MPESFWRYSVILKSVLHSRLNEKDGGALRARFHPKLRIKRHPSRETAKLITGGSPLCLRIPTPARFCNNNGFSLVELIVVILIIAILAVAVSAGGSAAIRKAHIAKATSDLHNFQIAVEMTLNETPRVANIATETKKAQLESIMDALNDNLAADYKLTAVDGTLTGNITKTAATTDDASFIICRSDKTDSWGNPYFVIIDRGERGGSSASEFYMTTVTAGPNAILHLDGAIDGDDVFSLTSYADGDVISATYNMAEAAPTIVGGAAAATTYTSAMTAPVNNGVTMGGYVAPASPAQQGGNNEQTSKQTPDAPTLSATSGSVTVGNTTSFTVSRQGTGAVSAVSANESVATVSVSGTTVTVTGVAAGTTTISVSAAEDASNTVSGSVSYTVTVNPAALTNLTGTSWHFNDTVDVSNYFSYNLTFKSAGPAGGVNNYSKLMVADDGPFSPKLEYGGATERYLSNGERVFDLGRVISITGGTDATNPDLISWLQSNATRAVSDLAGTTWTLNESVSYVRDVTFNVNYSTICDNSEWATNDGTALTFNYYVWSEGRHTFSQKRLMINGSNSGAFGGTVFQSNGTIYESFIDGNDIPSNTMTDTRNSSATYVTGFTFTGGTDATNLELISWLYSNATLNQ